MALDERRLDERDCAVLTAGHCPSCLQRGYVLGPIGLGINFNIECANVHCRDRFCIATHHLTPGIVISAHKIGNGNRGDTDQWPSAPN